LSRSLAKFLIPRNYLDFNRVWYTTDLLTEGPEENERKREGTWKEKERKTKKLGKVFFTDQVRSYDLGGSVKNVECSSTKRLHHELYFPRNPKRNRESSTIHALGISANQDNTRD
jgi:hypothetical protein